MGLSSFQALCVLNIHFGGDKTVSGLAYSEFLQNMTYQALTQENDNVELNFDQGVELAHSIVNSLNDLVNKESELSNDISERVNDALDIVFQNEDEKFIVEELPQHTSTPLSKEELNNLYEQQKEDYLKVSAQLNEEHLNAVFERAKIDNEMLYQEIINPTPGLVVHDKINQIETEDNNLSNATQKRLDKTLEQAQNKINSNYFPAPIISNTPNNESFAKKNEVEDIYIDDSLKDLAKPIHFKQPSTDDRPDFKLNLTQDQIVVFKSPFLDTSISIEKKELNNILQNIAEDLDSNLQTLDMTASEKQDTKQKKVIVKNITQKLDRTPNKNIQKQLESQKWLQSLVDDQLNIDNVLPFGNYTKDKQENKFKNDTKIKRMRQKSSPMSWSSTEEPSINMLLPMDKRQSIQSAKKVFSNIIQNVPPENYKKFKIQYDPQNQLTFDDEDEF